MVEEPVWFKFDGGILTAFSIMACAFLCHFNVIPTHLDLQDPTRERLKCIISTTMGCANLLYIVIACFGYLEFRNTACDNVLKNYDDNSVLISFGRLSLGITLLFTVPLLTQPSRDSLTRLIYNGRKVELSQGVHVLITTCLVVAFYILGSSVSSVVTIWSFLGSTVGIMIAYILPALMYLKLREPVANTATFYANGPPRMVHSASGNALPVMENLTEVGLLEDITFKYRLPAFFLLVAGLLLMIACTTMAVLGIIHTGGKHENAWCGP